MVDPISEKPVVQFPAWVINSGNIIGPGIYPEAACQHGLVAIWYMTGSGCYVIVQRGDDERHYQLTGGELPSSMSPHLQRAASLAVVYDGSKLSSNIMLVIGGTARDAT